MRKTSLAALFAAAFIGQAASAAGDLATVNGVPIPQSRMDLILKDLSQNGNANVDATMKERIKETIITNEVIRQEAIKNGLDKDSTFLSRAEQLKDQLLIRTFIDQFVKSHPVTEATARKEYNRIKVSMGSKEYLVRHILVDSEADAKSLIKQLKKGAKFDVLAQKNSKDPGSTKQGGELGWAVPDNYTPAFADAIRKMPKGKISDVPVKTEFGWHIIKVEDIRTTKGPAFTEVKDEVIRQMQSEALKKYVAEIVAKAKITQ